MIYFQEACSSEIFKMANGKVPAEEHDLLKKFTRKAHRITVSLALMTEKFLSENIRENQDWINLVSSYQKIHTYS